MISCLKVPLEPLPSLIPATEVAIGEWLHCNRLVGGNADYNVVWKLSDDSSCTAASTRQKPAVLVEIF